MDWKFSYLLILLFCYSCKSTHGLSEVDFIEVVRKSVYKKKYNKLEKYLNLEQRNFPPKGMYHKVDICLRMSNWIDTVQIDYWEEGESLRRCAIVGIRFETTIKEGKTLRRLVKEGQTYDWISSSSNSDYFISVDSEQITQIQKYLKKKKWYSGKVDGQWDLDLFKAIRFYDTFIIKSDFYNVFITLPQAVEQHMLYEMGIIKTLKLVGGFQVKSLAKDIQESLLKKGYEVEVTDVIDQKTKDAIIQFQRKNKLPEGQLDIETLKALGIDY